MMMLMMIIIIGYVTMTASIQRFSSVCFCHSFGNLPAEYFDQPRLTWSFTICIKFFALGN